VKASCGSIDDNERGKEEKEKKKKNWLSSFQDRRKK